MSNSSFYKYKILTKKAFEFQTQILSGKTMSFTKVEIGDRVVEEQELNTLESIKNKICDAEIISIVPKQNMVELTILLNGDGLNEVTLYREIGIYAQIDGQEVLYAYLNSDDKFDYIIPLAEGDQREFTTNKIKITLVVGNADNIKVTINNTTIPDNSVTMDMLNVEIKNYISGIEENLNKHIVEEIASEEGSHGFKYDENELKLKYKKNGAWKDIPTGQQVETEINKHKEKSILNAEGVHDFRYDESSQKFKYKKDGTWNDINTSGNTQGLEEHKRKSILNADGVHDFKCDGNEIFCYDNSSWRNIDVTAKHRGTRITGGDGVHGIRYDLSDKRLKYKNSNNWENIPTGQEEIDEHNRTKVNSVEGIHGLRYHDNKLQHYNESSQNWENVKQDVLVTGLTADVLKVGTTAVVETEGEELKRVTGTFTSDANAVASDIISGKTAYVNGNKITGNIVSKSGDQSIGTPSISGNNLFTPTIPNGHYNNVRFYFNKGNLLPENIKQGVNIFGINGNFAGSTSVFVILLYQDSSNVCSTISSPDHTLLDSYRYKFSNNQVTKFKRNARIQFLKLYPYNFTSPSGGGTLPGIRINGSYPIVSQEPIFDVNQYTNLEMLRGDSSPQSIVYIFKELK